MRHRWLQPELDLLKVAYGEIPVPLLARIFGCTSCAVKSAATRYGVAENRFWSAHDTGIVKASYGRLPTGEIVRRLGRTASQVRQKAKRLSLTRKNPMRHRQPAFVPFLRCKHALGWSDTEIAKVWGTDRHKVSERRAALGLSPNTYSTHRRDCVRRRTAEQLRRAGVPTLAALRSKVFRERARAAGWPEDLRPRAVQILNALWERGPMTRREIADVIGMPWNGVRCSLKSNDPEGSYLAHLIKRGLVVNLGRKVKGRGPGHSVCLYSLPLWIQRGKVSA